MQGVHPNAKAIPTSIAPMKPAGRRLVCTRFSWYSQSMRRSPMVWQEKTKRTMIAPGDAAEDRQPQHQELPDHARRRAERDKHQREADDEREGRKQDLVADLQARARMTATPAPPAPPRISSSDRPEMYER